MRMGGKVTSYIFIEILEYNLLVFYGARLLIYALFLFVLMGTASLTLIKSKSWYDTQLPCANGDS